MQDLTQLEVGYNIPATIGMTESEIQTPCLILDLDALERNLIKMAEYSQAHHIQLRPHGKMHKSVDVAKLQQRIGGATGLCCQKVSEAEAFVRGGITDILISNQVRDPLKIDRMARLPLMGAQIAVCVDDPANVDELSQAAQRHGTQLDCLVEIDCGAARCGVIEPTQVTAIAQAITAAPGLRFTGIQAYQGAMQHLETFAERQAKLDIAITQVKAVIAALNTAGLDCPVVTGGGTGSYYFEANSGVYTELQCGSYAFMDADYGRIKTAQGTRIDHGEWENALFVLTSIMSHPTPTRAVCDAGLKALSLESGLPVVFGDPNLTYAVCTDEHGTIDDPNGTLKINDRLRLVPGHCDPTCNLHDWYVGVRGGQVETLWPITARGKAF